MTLDPGSLTATTFAASLAFDNAFVRELPGDPDSGQHSRQVHGAAYSRVLPTPVQAPQLVAHSREVAALVGFDEQDVARPLFADLFGGNALIEGMEPYAANYGGHQFGQWAGQLGDGRAITLAEVINAAGQRWELQLKGAGPTPYSRWADGRAVLRSSLREFLCSEAMHHLGVPTTRALSLVLTGERVMRDMFYDGNPRLEPGAVVCRVAPSFIRFGNFQLPASRGDLALLNQLIDFTIRRDFPELLSGGEPADPAVRAEWFAQVAERTARMVADWMRVGFVHGVMNTDNMSILGLTIDYGPYGWVDDFDPNWTPNTTDAGGRRYRFGAQEQIAYWNLARFGEALVPVMPSVDPLHAGMERYVAELARVSQHNIAAKLGLRSCAEEDVALMHDLQRLLHAAEVDMTIFFRRLADVQDDVQIGAPSDMVVAQQLETLRAAFYSEEKRRDHEPAFRSWLERYTNRVRLDGPDDERRARMNGANPRYVLRNFLAQQAIDRAEQGELSAVAELLEVLRRPYDDQPGADAFDQRRPDWAKDRAGCSMLSCSS